MDKLAGKIRTPQRLPSGAETGYGLGWDLETLPLAGQPTRMAGHGSKEHFIGGPSCVIVPPPTVPGHSQQESMDQ